MINFFSDAQKEPRKLLAGNKGPGFGDIFSQGPIKLKATGEKKLSPMETTQTIPNNRQEHKVLLSKCM